MLSFLSLYSIQFIYLGTRGFITNSQYQITIQYFTSYWFYANNMVLKYSLARARFESLLTPRLLGFPLESNGV